MKRLEQSAVPVGRRGECALIGTFPDRAAADGAALLMRGEPGAGKAVLPDAAADAASAAEACVLGAAGVELDADLTFSRLQRRHPRGPGRKDLSRDTWHVKRGRRRVRPPANAVTHDLRRLRLWPVEPAAINETISDWEVHDERGRTGHS